ncbi:hypothetical protein EHR05_14955 [Leptospira licerasiae]|nr:hypothetical protein EHR05_14955 [Leptospira licerasiae]
MGNVSPNRYDVYPPESYTIGDEWHVVSEHIDNGSTVTDCALCGGMNNSFNLGPWFTCPTCPPGYTQTPHLQLCFDGSQFVQCCISTCSIHSCNTCHIPNWFTKYKVYRYRFLQWEYVSEYTVPGLFYA